MCVFGRTGFHLILVLDRNSFSILDQNPLNKSLIHQVNLDISFKA